MAEIYLKVDSAYPEDQGGGKARLDPDTMLQLRISPGNIVYIEGKRRTVAKVWRSMVSDWQQGKVRVDNFTRTNAGISIGDRVKVTPVGEEIEAKHVVLAPPEDLPRQLPINYNNAINRLIDFPVMKNDTIPIQAGLPFMQPQLVSFKAVVVEPENAIIITKNTRVEFSEKPAAGFEGLKQFSYEDIGGLKDELQRVRETIELPMRHPELFRKLGIDPPKGVLLFGPPGTGKTLIAKAVASESGAHFISIAGPEVISKYYGESEQRLREVFEEARQNAPSIIFIDELDSIAPRREEVTGEVERRVVAQLLTMMDGLQERGQVVVIGATNRVEAIDPALRRPGRFDREIDIGVPNETDRVEIMGIHTRGMPFEGTAKLVKREKDLEDLKTQLVRLQDKAEQARKPDEQAAIEKEIVRLRSETEAVEGDSILIRDEINRERKSILADLGKRTNGFVGADLAALAREGAIRALRRYLPDINLEEDEIDPEVIESMEVLDDDFDEAIRGIGPSAMREVLLEVPHTSWGDIGGLDNAKLEVREAVEYPLTGRELFEDLGIEPPKGVLLYGPPGTGKTLIAKAVATESGANFIPIRGPQLLSKWVGESERAVREIFKKARQVAPSIIFFDELDALAPARGSVSESHVVESVLNQILTEMDGILELRGVAVMGATNRPDIVDPALLRPGRFDRLVFIGEPNLADRVNILRIHTRYMPIAGSMIEDLVNATDGFDEGMIEDLFAAFGSGEQVTADRIAAEAGRVEKKENEGLRRGQRRRSIVDLLASRNHQYEDPARMALLTALARKTEGYVGSDLEALCREAGMFAMREQAPMVQERHFDEAVKKVHPTMNDRLREIYARYQDYFKAGLQKTEQPPEYQ